MYYAFWASSSRRKTAAMYRKVCQSFVFSMGCHSQDRKSSIKVRKIVCGVFFWKKMVKVVEKLGTFVFRGTAHHFKLLGRLSLLALVEVDELFGVCPPNLVLLALRALARGYALEASTTAAVVWGRCKMSRMYRAELYVPFFCVSHCQSVPSTWYMYTYRCLFSWGG